ncbi:hypothetical protein M0804_015313 [Polistes exclamans]|nr:hypothetical protein M0804_015313 [Polistes exclamans]
MQIYLGGVTLLNLRIEELSQQVPPVISQSPSRSRTVLPHISLPKFSAKRSTTNESHETSSSEDELQIDPYTDMLEKLTVEDNDSSDSDIVQPNRRQRVRINSNSQKSDMEEKHLNMTTYRQVKSGKITRSSAKCRLCLGQHLLSNCEQFRVKSVQDRLRKVLGLGECFNCLGGHHAAPVLRKGVVPLPTAATIP